MMLPSVPKRMDIQTNIERTIDIMAKELLNRVQTNLIPSPKDPNVIRRPKRYTIK